MLSNIVFTANAVGYNPSLRHCYYCFTQRKRIVTKMSTYNEFNHVADRISISNTDGALRIDIASRRGGGEGARIEEETHESNAVKCE